MLGRVRPKRDRIRRWLPGALAALTLALGASYAWAADATVQATTNTADYTALTDMPSIPAGGSLDFQVTGGTQHSVTAGGTGPDGRPEFDSGLFSGGTRPVKGVEYLNPGTHPFKCILHSGMQGILTIQAGTPKQRPAIRESVRSHSLSRVINRGRLKVKASSPSASGAPGARLVAKLGSHKLGTLKVSIGANASKTVLIKLTSQGRALLKARRNAGKTVKVRVFGSVSFGSSTKSAKKTLS